MAGGCTFCATVCAVDTSNISFTAPMYDVANGGTAFLAASIEPFQISFCRAEALAAMASRWSRSATWR
ncbi:hypothetical protein D3C71_1796220 [compost metagenome]